MCQDRPIINETIGGSTRALREYPEVWRLAGGTLQAMRQQRLHQRELRAIFTMVCHARQIIAGRNWLDPGCHWCGDVADRMCQGPPERRACLEDQWGALYICNQCATQFGVCRVCLQSMGPITLR
jgi:hypothetical protein